MKKQRKKRIIALAMTGLMVLSLTQNISYNPIANENEYGQVVYEELATVSDAVSVDVTTEAEGGETASPVASEESVELYGENESSTLPFMDIVYGFEITPGDTSSDPLSMGQSFSINMLFKLPEDAQLPLDSNYIYYFDLAEVAVEEDMTGDEIVGLIQAANTGTPLDIVMGNEIVGKYTIVDGLVTLNFFEGIEKLMKDETASRLGEFKFNCSLDESRMNDEGGNYTLMFSTEMSENPVVTYYKKTVIDVDVDIEKTAGKYNAADKTMEYTITLENTGNASVDNLIITDYMGEYLTLKNSPAPSIDNSAEVNVTTIGGSNDVQFTIASLPTGTTTLTYTCDVSDKAMTYANNASGNSYGLDNSIKAAVKKSDADIRDIYIGDKTTSQSTSFSVYKDIASKSVSVADDGSTVTWTIVINRGLTEVDLDGYVFADTMDSDLILIDDSVTVTCSNNTDPAANIDGLKAAILAGNAGSYTFPAGSKGEYTITYSAEVPPHAGMDSYKNEATMTKDGVVDRAPATTPNIGSEISEKMYIGTTDIADDEASIPEKDANGNLILKWQTTVAVPSNATQFVYTDYVQDTLWENGLGFKTGSLDLTAVDGNGNTISLAEGTDYTVVYNPSSSYDPDNMLTGTTYNMIVEFTPQGLAMIKADGETVVTMQYETIGRYTDRYKDDWQMYKNHYSIDVGSTKETGTASVSKNFVDEKSSGGVEKTVAGYDEKNHTITWKITVDPGNSTIEDLELTDVVNDMKYYGYSGEGRDYEYDGNNMYALVKYDWVLYQIKMTEVGNSGTTEHPVYTYKINFTDDMYIEELGTTYGQLDGVEKNKISKPLEIYYTTQVTGEYLYYNNYGTEYTNKVDATGVDELGNNYVGVSEVTTTLDTEVLSKNLITPDNGSTSVLEYSISINKDGLNLNPNKNYFIVEDDLPENLIYMTDGTVVKDNDENVYTYVSSAAEVEEAGTDARIYHVSYENSVLKFTVPDEVALNITYKVNMLTDPSKGSAQYINTVKLEEPYVAHSSQSSSNESRRVSSSSATISSILFKVEKISSQDVTKRLGGAVFTLTEKTYDGAGWVDTGVTYTATTQAGQLLKDSDFVSSSNTHPKKNCVYELSETTAPAGYEKTEQVYKFIILDDDGTLLSTLPSDVYPIMGGTTFVYSNTPLTTVPANKLTITKQYFQSNGTTPATVLPATGAVIEIYDQILTLDQCKSGSYTPITEDSYGDDFVYTDVYNSANPSVGHVITLEMIPDGEYTVYEKTAPDGYDVLDRVYNFTVVAGKISWNSGTATYEEAVTIDNKETYDNSIIINKRYFKASDTVNPLATYPEKAEFICTNNATGAEVEIKDVSGNVGFEYIIEKLPAGEYTLDEKASDIYTKDSGLPYTIEVDELGNIDITDKAGNSIDNSTGIISRDVEVDVDNVIKDNSITVNKKYYKANGDLITDTTGFDANKNQQVVDFVLYKKDGSNYVEVVSSNGVYADYEDTTGDTSCEDSYTWKNLEPGDYKIVEKLKTGDTTPYEPVADTYFTVGTDYKIKVTNGSTGVYDASVDVSNRMLGDNEFRFYFTKQISDQSGNVEYVDDTDFKFELTGVTTDGLNTDIILTFNYNANKQRWESTALSAGKYTLKEIQTKAGYVSAPVLTFEVSDDKKLIVSSIRYGTETTSLDYSFATEETAGGQTAVFNLVNRPRENSITITKKYYQPGGADEVTTAPNSGAKFSLYKVSGSTEILVKELLSVSFYVFSKLEPGEYVIKETEAPEGYGKCTDIEFTVNADYTIDITSLDSDTITVTRDDIDSNDDIYTVGAQVEAKNILSNKFEITKKYTDINGDEITGTDSGALFNATTFALYEQSYPTVDISSTNMVKVDGKITFTNLKDGTYTLEETVAPAGFTPASKITLVVQNGKITVSYAGTRTDFTNIFNNGTYEGSATLYNRQSGNELTINKTYYKADGTTVIPFSQVTNKASFRIINTATNAYVNNYTFNPNAGTYTFKNIPKGDYKIVETVPLGFETIADATFSVDLNGNITFTTPPSGWTTDATNATADVDVSVVNKMKANKLSLTKVYYDINGRIKTVPVTTEMRNMFKLVNSITGVESQMTYNDTYGLYEIANLMPGTYEVVEDVPAGYLPVLGKITVTVGLDATISATYTGGDASDFLIVNSGTLDKASIEFKNHEVTNLVSITKSYVSAADKPLSLEGLEQEEYATFKLYDNVTSSYVVPVEDTDKVKVNKETGVYTFANLDPGYYTIKETPGVGFEDDALVIEFIVTDEKKITSVSGATATSNSHDFAKYFEIVNKREPFNNRLTLSKTFINQGGESVDGTEYDTLLDEVEFAMYDEDGAEVSSFAYDSNIEGWTVEQLEPGDYIIKETAWPDNYVQAGDIEVSVVMTAPTETEIIARYTGNLTEDLVVTQDAQNLAEIELDLANHQKVENYFAINKKYVDAFGNVITDESVISELIKDTEFVFKAENSLTETYIPYDATTKQFVLEDIQTGRYIISEVAPDGYIAISDITLTVVTNGKITVTYGGEASDVVVTDSAVEVNKTTADVYNYNENANVNIGKYDIVSGEELPGAVLTITDMDGNVVDSWTSTESVHKVPIGKFEAGKEYTLTEVTAPFGYEIAENITFKLDNYGNVYIKSEDGTFELVDNNIVAMMDAHKYINISKVDLTNDKELPGAKLIIKDAAGNVIDEWTSTSEAHKILMNLFKPDTEYTLTEITAPDGYEIAESIVFKFDAEGNIYIKDADGNFKKLEADTIVMKDAPEYLDAPDTSDKTPLLNVFLLMLISLLGMAFVALKRRYV